MKTQAYTVGQLASRCGVAVKTVQFYADEGLLKASGGATEAGYRLFTDDDLDDLRAIRSLRALGFSLDSIRGMLGGSADPRSAAALQLEIVDGQLRALRRQRAVIASAIAMEDSTDVRHRLQLAQAAASLGTLERDVAIERFMDRVRKGAPLEGDSDLRRMIAMDLPDELTYGQLEAWLELSALIEDDSFVGVLRAQHEPFASRSDGPPEDDRSEKFAKDIGPIIGEAVKALEDGCDAKSDRVGALADRWAGAFARGLGRDDDEPFRRWLLDYARRTNDPRIQRFWELVAIMKGQSPGISPFIAAQQLLIDGLSSKLAK